MLISRDTKAIDHDQPDANDNKMRYARLALGATLFFSLAAFADPTGDKLSSKTSFDLPAQPLGASLKQLADQAGIQILFEEKAVEGIDAPALKAHESAAQAFSALLSRTDLEYTARDGTVAVRRRNFVQTSSDSTPGSTPAAEAATPRPADSRIGSDEAPPASLEEVVVTGSRLSAAFAAPTPVTAISANQLAQSSPVDIATALAQVPSLIGSILSTNGGAAGASTGTNGQSLLNLRGLGVNRTLVLLDGERLGTTNVQDSVDINIIPQSLLKRVDIVTGGASASYGSDAVAGVVNFVLDTNYRGFKADVSAGTTTYGDATNGKISLAFGKAFGDNLRVIGGLDWFREGQVGLAPTGRSWDDNPYYAAPNPVTGALPTTLVEPNGRVSNGTFGGLITGVAGCKTASCLSLVNQQFGPGGALEPFQQGAFAGSTFASGGQGAYASFGMTPSIDRENLLVHAELDVSPHLTLFSTVIAARTRTSLQAQDPYETGTYALTIFPNNAYLPASVAAVFAANPSLTSFTMGRISQDLGISTTYILNELGRVSVGAKGQISDRWSFDTSIAQQYTINNLDRTNTINRNIYAAADAVVNPANGQIVCASTLLGYDPGCVPVNLFGANSPSQAAKNYILGLNRGDTAFKQTAFESNLRGDLGDNFNFGAGPVNVAMGIAYRRDTADRHVDPLSDIYTSCVGVRGCATIVSGRYGGYQSYNPAPLYGSTGATEGYAEIGVPLLKDLPLVKSLTADFAGRITDYTISGFQDSWKLGLQWDVTSSVMLRATTSQDIRAPDVLELFNSGSTQVAQDLFPASNAPQQIRATGLNAVVGNPNLLPEIAHTSTAGIVLSPTWASGWQSSIDYYHIDIAHAIESLAAQGVIDGCYRGNQSLCRLITLNGVALTTTTGITSTTTGLVVTADTENVDTEATSGFDLESSYSKRLGDGTFTARVLANYLIAANLPTAVSGCSVTELVGAIGGCLGADGYPRWKGSVSFQYDTARYGVFVQERYINGGKADPWDIIGVSINRNEVPSVQYTDLTMNYAAGFGGRGKIYFNVTNLLNRSPPVTVTKDSANIQSTSFDVYDVLGRRYVLGYRLEL